jgi:type I restriction enzyme, S subunit
MPGDVPYWGASGIIDHVGSAIFDEPLVLLGEDGAPFFEPGKDVAFLLDGPAWVNNHIHVLKPNPGVDRRFLVYALNTVDYAAYITGSTRDKLTQDDMWGILIPHVPLGRQRVIADYLDRETAPIDALISAKRRLVGLLYERCDEQIGRAIEKSGLVIPGAPTIELRRVLTRRREGAPPNTPLVTAYRDGQVTLRSIRRAEGYTEAAADTGFQLVHEADVVIHGLDGFAGAIGTAEAAGACSPVYQVCVPTAGGDPHYWGRMLRVLATTGYMSLFVTSTRERAYDMRNWSVVGRIPMPQVAADEQRSVGDRLRAILPIRDIFERSVSLLQERRQALISAAVTGQLDIPEAP